MPVLTLLEATQEVLDISATERSTFRTCRRRWELEVLNNLEPALPPTLTLEFGTGLHEALEAYYIAYNNTPSYPEDGKPDPLEFALNAFDNWYDKTLDRFEAARGFDADSKALLLDNLVELGDLGEAMLTGYRQFAQVEDRFTVHAIEGRLVGAGQSWLHKHQAEQVQHKYPVRLHETGRLLVPIIDPKSGKLLPGKPVMSCRIDLLVHRIDPGMKGIWIYDHKSTGSQPNDRGLDFDDQVTSYCYAVWRWLGIIPRGVCLNYLIKQAPKSPRILKGDKLSTAKDQLTTAKQYRKELIARGLMLKDGRVTSEKHAAAYEGLLSRGWQPFFQRHYAARNEHELLAFERRLVEEYHDMVDVYEGERAYPNLSRFWCPGCRVNPICQAIEDGSDSEGIIESRYQQRPDRKALYRES